MMQSRRQNEVTNAAETFVSQGDRIQAIIGASPDMVAQVDEILFKKRPQTGERDCGPILLKMGEAAEKLGVSRTTMWRLIKAGRIPRVQLLPGSFRIRRDDLAVLVEGSATTMQNEN